MAIVAEITSSYLTETNPAVSSIMPAYTYLRDLSVVNFGFTVRWSGFTKVTSIEATVGVYPNATTTQHTAWLFAKEEKLTALSGTRTYSGQMFVPQLGSGYGPGLTSLTDGTHIIKFSFAVWTGTSSYGSDVEQYTITYATLKAPSADQFDAYRALANGTPSDEGTYIRYSIRANITPTLSTDRGTFLLRYRLSSTSTWSSITLGSNVTSVNVSAAQLPITCAISNSCEMELVITDRYTSVTIPKLVPTGSVLMHFKADKSAVAIGKYAENSSLFDVNLPSRFRQGITSDVPLPLTSGGTGVASIDALKQSMGFAAAEMTGYPRGSHATGTYYLERWSLVSNYTNQLTIWAIGGASGYVSGFQVKQSGYYQINAMLWWYQVSVASAGHTIIAVYPSSSYIYDSTTVDSIEYYAAKYLHTYSPTTSNTSTNVFGSALFYIPANAIVVVYGMVDTTKTQHTDGKRAHFSIARMA